MSTELRKPVQPEEGGSNMIRPLRIFLNKLAKEITDEDLEELCFIMKFESSMPKPIDLFRILMKKGLTENNLEELAEHFSNIGRNDLEQSVVKFSETNGRGVWSLPQTVQKNNSGPKGNGVGSGIQLDPSVQKETEKIPVQETDNHDPSTLTSVSSTDNRDPSALTSVTSTENVETDGGNDKLGDEFSSPGEFTSFLDKFKKSVQVRKKEKAEIELHNYQKELARPGLAGKNCIICAPTGSGKTMTAGHICQQLRMEAKKNGKTFKALFIVCIRNLIQQQTDALSLIVKNSDAAEQRAVGGIGETSRLSEYMKNYDVTVLTAQILVNCLQNKEMTLVDIDLLIMDECHHTTLSHPYNVIMLEYLKMKKESPRRKLPQIIGLTASLGVGTSGDDPLVHYIRLCANLDSDLITHVKENMNELLKYSPRPREDQIIAVEPRKPQNQFSQMLKLMMEDVEKMVSFPLTNQRHPEGTQQYENWIVDQMREAEQRGLQDTIVGTEALRKLNAALIIFDDLRAKDAKKLLDDYFTRDFLAADPIEIASRIHQLYSEVSPLLDKIAKEEKMEENAKLEKLCSLLTKLYEADSDARGILLTRTRTGVEALITFIKEIPHLKEIVYPAKLVGQGRKEGTMTDVEQENTLRLFRLGRDDPKGCNLLVATDVAQEGLDMPKCNFVIRYNFVSNEIGTVQSKGRARAPNSECYLIVGRDSVNEKREWDNLTKEDQMMRALSLIDEEPEEELVMKIRREQDQIWQKYQQKNLEKKTMSLLLDSENVYIHCRNCNTFLCKATDMRRRLQNYICVAPDLLDKIFVRKSNRPEDRRYDTQIGVFFCKNSKCNKQLGPQIQYKQGQRLLGYAFGKDNVLWRHEGEEQYRQIKQWSKVPFPIEEEPM